MHTKSINRIFGEESNGTIPERETTQEFRSENDSKRKGKKSNTIWKSNAFSLRNSSVVSQENLTNPTLSLPLCATTEDSRMPRSGIVPKSEFLNDILNRQSSPEDTSKESFVDGDEPNNTPNYGHNIFKVKSNNEDIILSTTPRTQVSDEQPSEVEPPFIDIEKITDLFKNMDPNQAKLMYNNGIKNFFGGLKNINSNLASPLSSFFFDDINSPTAKKEMGIISSQISLWITATVTTYIIVVNWWYIWCYTNFHIDFRDYVLSPVHWAMAPAFNALELINYYILTFRMDANFAGRERLQSMWNYRPILFCLFHAIVMAMLVGGDAAGGAASVMMNEGIFFAIMSLVSIIYFASLLMQEKWSDKFLNAGSMGIMIFIGMLIGAIIGMFVFIAIVCPFFMMYISFFSYWSILAFNYFYPPAVYSTVNQIFQELKEAPVSEENKNAPLGRLFQNAHTIYIFSLVLAILTANITQSALFTNKSLMAFAIILNLLIAFLLTSGVFSFIWNAILMVIRLLSGKKVIEPAEIGEIIEQFNNADNQSP